MRASYPLRGEQQCYILGYVANPYRMKAELSRRERAAAELVYPTGDRERRIAPVRSALQVSILGAVGGAIAAAAGLPELGAGVILGAVGLGFWRWRRTPEVSGLVFHVEDGELAVRVHGSSEVVARTRLVDLRDVTLDTKSIRKVEPARSVVPAVQFIESQVGPEIDVARIVLEVDGRAAASLPLTEAFLAHTDSVEWVGRIRVFLRSHGWLPEDERARVSVPDEDELEHSDGVARRRSGGGGSS